MKRLALALAIIAFIGFSAAVVSEDGASKDCPPGEMCVTGASSSSTATGTVAVGPNGTEYESKVSMTGSTCLEPPADGVSNVTFADQESSRESVSFNGEIQTPNPCHNIEAETLEVSPGIYRLNITSVKPDQQGPCTQCLGAVRYDASFEADKPFKLEIAHEGENIDTLEHPDYGQNKSDKVDGPNENGSSSLVTGVMNWLRSFIL